MHVQDTDVGPRLSDARFFGELVDVTRPGLEGIPQAIARSDYAEARPLFAAEVRRTLQPERLLSVRRRFRGTHFMREGETLEQATDRILRLELISTHTPHQFKDQVDWFANPTFNQYREWTWQLSRHPEWALLAERYRQTGDERLSECFVRLFQSWVRQAIVPVDAPGSATLCWRTIETGIRMGGAWQWALHSFYRSPHFTDDVLVDWYKSVWEHGWRLRNFHRTGNWLIMEMNGLAQVGILYPQFRDAAAWQAYAFDRLVRELDVQVYPDGFQIELSTGYHQVVVHNYQWLMDICAAYDVTVPDTFSAGLERMHSANVRLMMPDGRLPDLNDGGWIDVAPLLEGTEETYPDHQDLTWARTRGLQGHPPAETSTAFANAGYYVMRTGWEPDAIWALFDGGPFGYGHQHEDKLNILLHAYGRMLATEGGDYAYDDSEMRRYVLSTRAHNTIRVDGQDQNRRFNYSRERFDPTALAGATWHTSPDHDLAEAIYDEGYGPNAATRVQHRRTVVMLKESRGDMGPCLLVFDRLLPSDDARHAYQLLWHLDGEDIATDGLAVRTIDAGMANLSIMASAVAGMQMRIVSGQETPEWQGWRSIKQHQQGQYVPLPTAIYEWEATGVTNLVTLLYPTRAGQTCPVVGISPLGEHEETGASVELAAGGHIVLKGFRSNASA